MYAKATNRDGDLWATILVLEHTSTLLKNFHMKRNIRSTADPRFEENRKCLEFFKDWKEQPGKRHTVNFITRECFVDLISMVVGLEQLVAVKLQNHQLGYIAPHRVNTDVVENFFCSHRGINGANTNPTALQYAKGINTIQISRKLVSTKSNAGGKTSVGGAKPYKFYAQKSFKTLRV